jgi:hypothetical protein
MQKLVWQNANGDEINLTGGNYGITEWEGFSNTSLNIQSQQVPFQDGGVFLDALIEQRELSVTLKMQDNGKLEERYRMRRELIHALNPKLGEGYLIYTNDFTSKRIKCIPQIPLFENHNSNDSGTPKASLSWTACEPYWEDLEETVVFLEGSRTLVNNDGDVDCNVKIETKNGINSVFVKNLTNEKFIQAENLEQDKNYIINTNFGNKSIKGLNKTLNWVAGGNIIDSVSVDDDIYLLQGLILIKYSIINNTFEKITLPFAIPYHEAKKITYLKNKEMFCIATSTKLYCSNDLINWDEYDTINFNIRDLVTINNTIYAVSYYQNNSNIYYTTDGENWTIKSFSDIRLSTICSSDNTFCIGCFNGSKILTGENIDNLTEVQIDYSSVTKVRYLNNNFVAIAYLDNYYYIIKSDDALVWEQTEISRQADAIVDLCYFNSKYEFIYRGYIIVSSDLTDENILNLYGYSDDIYFCYNEKTNTLFLVGSEGILSESSNGYDFIEINQNFQKFSEVWKFIDLFFINNKFVSGTYLYYESENGKNWFKTDISSTPNVFSLCYGMNVYASISAFSLSDRLLVSEDFKQWQSLDIGVTHMKKILYGENHFYIMDSTHIYKNTNSQLTSWEIIYTAPAQRSIKDFIFVDGKLYCITDTTNNIALIICINEDKTYTEKQYNFNNSSGKFINIVSGYNSIYIIGTDVFDEETKTVIYKFSQINESGKLYVITPIVKSLNAKSSFIFCDFYFAIIANDGLYIWDEDFLQKLSSDNYIAFSYGNNTLCLLMNEGSVEIVTVESESNEISKLTPNSDMDLKLNIGQNILFFNDRKTNVCKLIYRQKYLGV